MDGRSTAVVVSGRGRGRGQGRRRRRPPRGRLVRHGDELRDPLPDVVVVVPSSSSHRDQRLDLFPEKSTQLVLVHPRQRFGPDAPRTVAAQHPHRTPHLRRGQALDGSRLVSQIGGSDGHGLLSLEDVHLLPIPGSVVAVVVVAAAAVVDAGRAGSNDALRAVEVGRAHEAAEEDAAPDGERGGGWGRGHCKAYSSPTKKNDEER